MFAALISALTIQSIPPALPEPPTADRLVAAERLYSSDPNTSENSWGISIAAAQVAGEALTARNAQAYDRDFLLSDRLRKIAKEGQAEIIHKAITCVATEWAQRLSLADLEALRTFIQTPSGRNFWLVHVQDEPWQACFRGPVEAYLAPHLEAEISAVITATPIR